MATSTAQDGNTLASPLVAAGAEPVCQAVAKAEHREEQPPELTVPHDNEDGGEIQSQAPVRNWIETLGVEDALQLLQPLREQYSDWLEALRPWKQFMQFRWPRGFREASSRVPGNLRTFWANYAVVALVCLGAAILMCPLALVVVLLLGFLWSVVLKRMDDPAWKVHIGHVEVGKQKQMIVFGTVTVLAMLLFVAPIVLVVVPSCGPVVMMHAMLNPSPSGDKREVVASSPSREGGLSCPPALPGDAEPAADCAE